MRRLVLAMLLALIPLTGFAQQQYTDSYSTRAEDAVAASGLSTDQALVIGLGVLVGAIGLNIVVGGSAATVVGALAGALIGNWWFEKKGAPDNNEAAYTYSASYEAAR